jgi:hypothetical protein
MCALSSFRRITGRVVAPKYNQQSHMRNPDDLRNALFQKTFAVASMRGTSTRADPGGGESPLLFHNPK